MNKVVYSLLLIFLVMSSVVVISLYQEREERIDENNNSSLPPITDSGKKFDTPPGKQKDSNYEGDSGIEIGDSGSEGVNRTEDSTQDETNLTSETYSGMMINLDNLSFSENGEIWKSSAFLTLKTGLNTYAYTNEFPEHHTTRLFHIPEWALLSSQCFSPEECGSSSYLSILYGEKDKIQYILDNSENEKFIVPITGMPIWLSNSNDETIISENGRQEFHNHAPRDYEKWNELIRETVRFLEQFREVEWYIEVGNEPDLGEFWKEDTNSLLKLYEETAKTVKNTNPEFKVGGLGVNRWNGINNIDNKTINIELIKYASEKNIPLDFISWHFFGLNPTEIKTAQDSYESEFNNEGYVVLPEFIISEWNSARGTEIAAALSAENFVQFSKEGIDSQTFSSWEDFILAPEGDLSGWGLITQRGEKKPAFYIHEFFDTLSRESEGIEIMEIGTKKYIISKEINGCYDLIVWNSPKSGMTQAIEYLVSEIGQEDLLNAYGKDSNSAIKIAEDILKGYSRTGNWDAEFSEANEIYIANLNIENKVEKYEFKLDSGRELSVIKSESVKRDLRNLDVSIENRVLNFELENFEVGFIKVC